MSSLFPWQGDDPLDPQNLADNPQPVALGFRMTVEDVFDIPGVGVVVTGRIDDGTIARGAKVGYTDQYGLSREVTVQGIELARQLVDHAQSGDPVGLLLRGIMADDISKGAVIHA